jgi:alpha-tubulin suppressor-like RCC1 family protein
VTAAAAAAPAAAGRVRSVVCGRSFAAALMDDGTVQAWGKDPRVASGLSFAERLSSDAQDMLSGDGFGA